MPDLVENLPRMFAVRQRFPRPREQDVRQAVFRELEKLFPAGAIPDGAEVGVTAGSRGITNIAPITRAACDFLKTRGARPFIIPAMGSHGGATGDAQRHLIEHYGISEDAMGVPIRHSMETRSLGQSEGGVEVFFAETAWAAHGILLLNRVKPHTDFRGKIESGLSKICAIGLGKYRGAVEYHSHALGVGLEAAIRGATSKALEAGKILGGLAILENAYHETAEIAGVSTAGFFASEEALLEKARRWMGTLPFKKLDILMCDRMGKNISGAGLDTNITGRGAYGYVQGVPWREELPSIFRILVRSLSEQSDGNAVGMGSVDIVTERFARRVDRRVTTLNAVTARAPGNARLPIVARSDREMLELALMSLPRLDRPPLIVHSRDTLELENVYVSEGAYEEVCARDDLEVLSEPAPVEFDEHGDMTSPFGEPGRAAG